MGPIKKNRLEPKDLDPIRERAFEPDGRLLEWFFSLLLYTGRNVPPGWRHFRVDRNGSFLPEILRIRILSRDVSGKRNPSGGAVWMRGDTGTEAKTTPRRSEAMEFRSHLSSIVSRDLGIPVYSR